MGKWDRVHIITRVGEDLGGGEWVGIRWVRCVCGGGGGGVRCTKLYALLSCSVLQDNEISHFPVNVRI